MSLAHPARGVITTSYVSLWPAAAALCVVVALALQAFLHVNADTSWLLYVAEHTLDGAVPYRDILETNPPASFLLYVPAVVVARLVGLSPEFVTVLLTMLAAGLSVWLCDSILARAGLLAHGGRPALLFASCIVLLLLPMSSFAQREHIVLLAILPALASIAARSRGASTRLWQAVLAGTGGGVVLAVKPVFALAFVGPLLWCWRCRSWRTVLTMPEAWIAGVLALGYGMAVLVFCPDFSARVLPLVLAIYVPARLDLITLFELPVLWIWLVLAATALWVGRRDGLVITLIAASLGFEAALFIQGKGFTYHGYPAIALAAFACAWLCVRAGQGLILRWPSLGTAPAAAALVGSLCAFTEYNAPETQAPGLARAVADIDAHPRLMTVGANMYFGRSFARELGGDWVSSTPIAWITCYASAITKHPEDDPRFAVAIRMERELYAADITTGHPDVILIDGEGWMRWTRHSPALVEALSHYDRVGQFGEIILMRHSPGTAGAVEPLHGPVSP